MIDVYVLTRAAALFSVSAVLSGCGDKAALREADPNLSAIAVQENPVTGDLTSIIPENDIASVRESAQQGNSYAAYRLAQHYRELGRASEQIEWLEVAAARGDCASIDQLRSAALDRGDRERADRWNDQLRTYRCTSANTYAPARAGNSLLDMPLWVD